MIFGVESLKSLKGQENLLLKNLQLKTCVEKVQFLSWRTFLRPPGTIADYLGKTHEKKEEEEEEEEKEEETPAFLESQSAEASSTNKVLR